MAHVTTLVCQYEGYLLMADYHDSGGHLEIEMRYLGTKCLAEDKCRNHDVYLDELPIKLLTEDDYCNTCSRQEAYCDDIDDSLMRIELNSN